MNKDLDIILSIEKGIEKLVSLQKIVEDSR